MGHVGGRRFSVGELHAASKTSSANGSHLNVWDFDISAAEFPQQKKRASLNGTRWRTRFWRQREVRRRKNVVRQRAPFKCMGFWYIHSRISAAEKKRASLVWIGPKGPKGLFTPKTRVFSAAEILLRIYQNPIHLNETRWRTTFWRQREVRRRKKR